ncbi:ATP synthase F1 subunit delta [Candidatus Babeliales bacterium]|nr:ATP synthase F1 subunit delta [Candidatus Babeliales bacterium]
MDIGDTILAKRYACAFVNVAGDALGKDDIQVLAGISAMLNKQRGILFFLTLPLMNAQVVERALCALFDHCSVGELLKKITLLLIQHKRVILLPDVLRYIELLCKDKACCKTFTITSSDELSDQQLRDIVVYLERETAHKVLYTHSVDKGLIAGLRLQSDTLLWEYSVKKNIETIRRSMIDTGD